MRRNRTTGSGGFKLPDDGRRRRRGRGAGVRRTMRALGRLARARGRVRHVPTRMQVRAMAHFDSREPSSYLLDPTVNFAPELPLGDEDPLGRHALRFTGEHAGSGRKFELVALPDGGAFDRLGMSG
ncbi:MAG TPA: hypothetical protein VJ741_16665 [Solirubrobacteraceae bacterium]|nr:hypothetical protein [Solirubrobacteraceae bacterium]